MTEVNMVKAKETYDSLCKMLDEGEWKYEKQEEDLLIHAIGIGEDLPMVFLVNVIPELEIVSFVSMLPFEANESKIIDMALAVCAANKCLPDGAFQLDLTDGTIMFRLTTSYKSTQLSHEVFEYMIHCSLALVDKYNDKFLMICNDMMSVEEFMESL